MNKKKLANLIMVMVVIAIIGSGIVVTGRIRGWFDTKKDASENMVVNEVRGIVNVTRSNITFEIKKGEVLRDGDIIESGDKSEAAVVFGNNRVIMDADTSIRIVESEVNDGRIYLESGQIFADMDSGRISWENDQYEIYDSTFCLNVLTGSANCYVFAGNINQASAGKMLQYVGCECEIADMKSSQLGEFELLMLSTGKFNRKLCYSAEEVNEIIASRNRQVDVIKKETRKTIISEESSDDMQKTSEMTTENNETQDNSETEKISETTTTKRSTDSSVIVTERTTQKATERNTERKTEKVTQKSTEKTTHKVSEKTSNATKPIKPTKPTTAETTENKATYKCTINIDCKRILQNMDKLTSGKDRYVPRDGIIVNSVEVEFTDGETVFDVLKRTCNYLDIPLEYTYTPVYGSYYIEGINNLYEKDCGSTSGWIYEVNAWRVPYGCSSCKVKPGDVIVWSYVTDVTQ